MNNEELKKKISQIISEYCCPYGKTHKQLYGDDRMCYSKMNFAECNPITECTSALIAAGIGDVKEAEQRAEVAEKALRVLARKFVIFAFPNGDWKELIEQLVSETKEQAEKELAEERKNYD